MRTAIFSLCSVKWIKFPFKTKCLYNIERAFFCVPLQTWTYKVNQPYTNFQGKKPIRFASAPRETSLFIVHEMRANLSCEKICIRSRLLSFIFPWYHLGQIYIKLGAHEQANRSIMICGSPCKLRRTVFGFDVRNQAEVVCWPCKYFKGQRVDPEV